MNGLQRENLREIESLNQRGGRTLSIVDLISDGTLTAEMGGYLLASVASGVSVLTAAQPSGAGKSTLLADILGFLPPGEQIVSVTSPAVIAAGHQEEKPTCYLVHEIGSGSWEGYIWGQQVCDYFRLADSGHRLAACLHADTMDQLRDRLHSACPALTKDMIGVVGLICFMQIQARGRQVQRRVSAIYGGNGSEYELVYSWQPSAQQFTARDPAATLIGEGRRVFASAVQLVEELVAEDIRDLAACQQRVVTWYRSVPELGA